MFADVNALAAMPNAREHFTGVASWIVSKAPRSKKRLEELQKLACVMVILSYSDQATDQFGVWQCALCNPEAFCSQVLSRGQACLDPLFM
jgi:hypothetical protein